MLASTGEFSLTMDTSSASEGDYVQGWLSVADGAGNIMIEVETSTLLFSIFNYVQMEHLLSVQNSTLFGDSMKTDGCIQVKRISYKFQSGIRMELQILNTLNWTLAQPQPTLL
jgi:hypothetical protein